MATLGIRVGSGLPMVQAMTTGNVIVYTAPVNGYAILQNIYSDAPSGSTRINLQSPNGLINILIQDTNSNVPFSPNFSGQHIYMGAGWRITILNNAGLGAAYINGVEFLG